MKTRILSAALLLTAAAATAKTLVVTVQNVRNDRGNILVMANIPGQRQPVFGMAAAREGAVEVRLEGIEGSSAQVSLFHDEDGDYKMKQGDRGPEEGYSLASCELPDTLVRTAVSLHYPVAESEPEEKNE